MRSFFLKLFAAFAWTAYSVSAISRDVDAELYGSPDRMVDIGGGQRLNIRCSGSGKPTVIFESALGGAAWDWAPVHQAVSARTRACVYDRAGLGFSDPSKSPGTTKGASENLARLLDKAGERAPYILVGASYGAMIVRYFAAQHTEEVVGLVLVDGHHEDELSRINKISNGKYLKMMTGLQEQFRWCADAAIKGMPPETIAFKTCVGAPPPFAGRKLAAANIETMLNSKYWSAAFSEMENLYGISSDQLREVRYQIGNVPILALARSVSPFSPPGKQPSALSLEVEKENLAMQQDIASLSQNGKVEVVPKASQAIQVDNPSAVTDSVLGVVGAARR